MYSSLLHNKVQNELMSFFSKISNLHKTKLSTFSY